MGTDAVSQTVYCNTCRRQYVTPWDEWAAGLKAGDRVYVQPCIAWHGLSRSQCLIVDRVGDDVTVQIIGLPESRVTTTVAQLAQHDVTPRKGAL